ncbi:hypothetical protein [Haloprofundus halobius]|uniref:hypothetical protein n=1 Tax=Haloprofundus halobius TaxID=2876194 RepID=UPI001CCF0B2F|nr:hypothetical protein [Haloprofundus halobius]
MADFTIFEVHLHDGFSFSPTNTAPMFGGEDDQQREAVESAKGRVSKLLGRGATSDGGDVDQIETAVDADESTEADETESGGNGGKLLLALVLVVVVAAAAKTLMGDDAGFDELEELDELSEEA